MEILDFINNYWSVLTFIVIVIASWVRYEGINKDQDKEIIAIKSDVAKLQDKLEKHDAVVNTIKEDMVEIKTILRFVKEKLDK